VANAPGIANEKVSNEANSIAIPNDSIELDGRPRLRLHPRGSVRYSPQEDAMPEPTNYPEPEEVQRRKKERGLEREDKDCRDHASYDKNEPPADRGVCEKESTSQGSE
jgi:hypothetical protein